jgi:hypothetical protein
VAGEDFTAALRSLAAQLDATSSGLISYQRRRQAMQVEAYRYRRQSAFALTMGGMPRLAHTTFRRG